LQWKEKGLVDDVIASNEVKKGRPYPYMIEQLMQRAGVSNPMEVAKVGDTTVDIEEGKNAGCAFVIGVTWGAGAIDELEKMNPTHLVTEPSHLPEILFS
jgi:phosphoglycolate phosphatase-like HAD superfamily hydrolase